MCFANANPKYGSHGQRRRILKYVSEMITSWCIQEASGEMLFGAAANAANEMNGANMETDKSVRNLNDSLLSQLWLPNPNPKQL